MPHIGEIRMFAGNYAPAGWALCNGALLPIFEFEHLYQLIGTTYGGDGESTFALPDLCGRVPVHRTASNLDIAESGGVEEVTLTQSHIPVHTHALLASQTTGNEANPGGNVHAATSGGVRPYVEDAVDVSLAGAAVSAAGGSQPHDNLQPFVTVTYIIALYGVYPTPN